MTTERLEVRIDSELRRKLDELAKARGRPVSAVVRDAIDQAYETDLREKRLAAVERLRQLNVEDVPDMETLRRQLDETHEIPEPY